MPAYSLRGLMMCITMLCISIVLLGRPISLAAIWAYDAISDPFFTGGFCNMFRHLQWLVGVEPVYFDYDSARQAIGSDDWEHIRTTSNHHFAGFFTGLILSVPLHIFGLFLLCLGWTASFNELKIRKD